MITFDTDIYQGITLHSQNLPTTVALFESELEAVLNYAVGAQKRIVWITLSITNADFIPSLTAKGFVFHSCFEDEITLILRIKADVYVPFSPTHTIGLGGVVLRDNGQGQTEILLIKERLGEMLKLPGGHMELNETIEQGVLRETAEETGIYCQFGSVIAVASVFPYQLGKSNIYLACLLRPLNEEIKIEDIEEIEFATWMALDEFFSHTNVSLFAKNVVKSALANKGLTLLDLDKMTPHSDNRRRELFTYT